MNPEEVRQIAEEHLEHVRPSGSDNIMASCPFHETDNPRGYSITFGLSLTKGVYHCFSCGASGTLYDFLRKMGHSPEVARAHQQLVAGEGRKRTKKKQREHPVLPESLLGVFDYIPQELLDAGFKESTLKLFEVGYNKKAGHITYPVRNLSGELIAIVARVQGSSSKYVPYEKTLLQWGVTAKAPDLGSFLWNMHRVYPEVQLSKIEEPVVLVEGYKACMWVHQCGYSRVVHSFGSEITDIQAKLLERLGTEVVIMYDGDRAGMFGAIKSGNKLRKSMRVRVGQLGPDEQPDDLTIEEIEYTIDRSMPFGTWKSKVGDPQWLMQKKETQGKRRQ